jgi:hypothetical protein
VNNCWQRDDLLFHGGGSFAGLVMRGAGEFDQAARSLLLITAQPLAHGRHGGLKQTSGGFEAALTSALNQTQAMIVGVAHFTHQDEVGSRHASGMVRRAGERQRAMEKWKSRKKQRRGISTFPPPRRLRLDGFLTPQANLKFSMPLRTHTFQCRQGDTMWVGSTNPRPRLTPFSARL